jgi:hypothetical protein
MFDDHNIAKTEIDSAKLRELSNQANCNPNFVIPSILIKEAVHIDRSEALKIS